MRLGWGRERAGEGTVGPAGFRRDRGEPQLGHVSLQDLRVSSVAGEGCVCVWLETFQGRLCVLREA